MNSLGGREIHAWDRALVAWAFHGRGPSRDRRAYMEGRANHYDQRDLVHLLASSVAAACLEDTMEAFPYVIAGGVSVVVYK